MDEVSFHLVSRKFDKLTDYIKIMISAVSDE